MDKSPLHSFRRMAAVSLFFLCAVMVAGSLVRISGSGMGCPDWPFCFGKLIPPVSVDQLPADYAQKYVVEGRPAVFNAFNTWAEFLNRLVGVIAGLSLMIQSVWAFRLGKDHRRLFLISLGALGLTIATGLLGAKVVSAYLRPALVTLHLLFALGIIGVQLRLLYRVHRIIKPVQESKTPVIWKVLGWVGFVLTLGQMMIGIRVREETDSVTWNNPLDLEHLWNFFQWDVFTLHQVGSRLAGLVVLILAARLTFRRDRVPEDRAVALGLGASVGLLILVGTLMSSSFYAPWEKTLHLLASVLLFSSELLMLWRRR